MYKKREIKELYIQAKPVSKAPCKHQVTFKYGNQALQSQAMSHQEIRKNFNFYMKDCETVSDSETNDNAQGNFSTGFIS